MKQKLEEYFDRLWPINRSLTGNGVRKSLEILSEIVEFNITEVPSGTVCFDWTVPPEWNIVEGWVKDSSGKTIIDFKEHNLHILGYSEPVKGKFTYDELQPHLYTLPEQPELIPYLTSYYKRRWGFCMSHIEFEKLDKAETYEVFIDSTLDDNGSMTIAEATIKGTTDETILLSTYICHPSMANNELSGPLVASFIYNQLKTIPNLRYTYKFIFVPETIGSIYYLSKNGENLKENLTAGFVITCIGDPGRAAEIILSQTESNFNIIDFFPSGSDERQFCSPGFNLPVGSLIRTMYGKYPEYHTSADNKDFISFEAMEGSVNKYLEIIDLIELNQKYINTLPYCEPQLGKRGLYPTLGSQKGTESYVKAMMWILNLTDGDHDLIDISLKSKIPILELKPVLFKLLENNILKV